MHFNEFGHVLSFDELWRATGLKKSQVQNWTNGRPFKIRGTIAHAAGKGSRNLYSIRDAYFLVFLQDLRGLDLAHSGLQRVIDHFDVVREEIARTGERDYFDPEYAWLAVNLTDRVSVIPLETLSKPAEIRMGPSLELDDARHRGARQFVVNIAKIRDEVDGRLEKLLKRKSNSRTSRSH